MSPAVVAIARAFSKDSEAVAEVAADDVPASGVQAAAAASLKRRVSSEDMYSKASTAVQQSQHSLHRQHSHYHYDPYHQYCRTGSDYYKSYHLSYQAYCHAPKSKFVDNSNCSSFSSSSTTNTIDPRFYDRLAALRPPNNSKLANARIRAARLRRRIADFRDRTSAWIQRLALLTISVTVLSYIFTQSLLPSRVAFNPLYLRHGLAYSKTLVGYYLRAENGTTTLVGAPAALELDGKTGYAFENVIGRVSQSPSEDLPFIARNVFMKFYALGFLVLIIAISYVCERLFGRKLTSGKIHLIENDEEEEDISDDDDLLLDDIDDDDDVDVEESEIEVEDDEDSYYGLTDDMYWDCQPTSIRVPQLLPPALSTKLAHLGHHFAPPTQLQQLTLTDLKISLLYCLPLRLISRIWGWANAVELPVAVRAPLYTWYATTFGCNLEEMEVEDLTQFRNLSEFFRRSLKPGVRPLGEAAVVSPADGRLVQLETLQVATGYVGSVKGIYYSVERFLGCSGSADSVSPFRPQLKPGHRLYSAVVYLCPGDYHRFHAPTDWTVTARRHFSGRLFSVKPSFVASLPDLFSINERVVYAGQWKHGFFSMTAVGATNVGTVAVFCDPELQTNRLAYSLHYSSDKHFKAGGVAFRKGDLFGEFNLGSTIVLLYEAPEKMQFCQELQQQIKYGENLCSLPA